MFASEHFNTIAALDLEPIKVKLMHVESGEGWSLKKVNAVEIEYRRFLYLMKMFPQEQTAPLMDVDIFWHYHILDTMKYAIDCEAVFGYFLHHFPYIGLRGEDDEAAHERVGQRMKELYESTFGEPYGIGARADTPAQAFSDRISEGTAFSGRISAETAFSGRVADQTAFSGRISAQTAFSGRVADRTAFSGRISATTAFSGSVAAPTIAAQVAFSGRISSDNVTAFSGRVADRTAFSGRIQAAAPAQDKFYAARPRITAD
jgi:Glycine-rich domain-containing protein-like